TVDFDAARKWLTMCLEHHGDACGSLIRPATENLKLIDCQTRLVVNAKKEDDYLALSYTWGDAGEVTRKEQQQDVSFLQLPIQFPETILDAIKVTQQLGYRYLWVDAYCVDRTWADFHDQLRQMDAIYHNAVLTIVGAAGSGPRYGLPGVGHRRRAFPQVQIGQYSLSPALPVPEIDTRNCAWATRAWTFQEGLLSTRRLLFTEEQVYFECRRHHCTEILDLTVADIEKSRLTSPLQGVGHKGLFPVDGCGKHPWDIYSRITEYSSRELSYEGDILNGILGVFRAFERKQHPIRHFWGVP
ncbi:heterokaryon incompatibility protein-domain-containing protein, partial [Lophiotrema nucula]